ncbi:MAG: hypothetical protein VX589_12205 [Myxococcota bacterium]|nr:hypothetical protein [Myxococcota bacterium]
MNHLILKLCVLNSVFILGCTDRDPAEPFRPNPAPVAEGVDFFSRFTAFGVGPGATYSYGQIERLAVQLVDQAEARIDAALGEFESSAIADALIRAADERGVEVRVVADTDRLAQIGFQRLFDAQSARIDVVDGDGPIQWKPIFDKDPVLRAGDQNLMVHHFIIADRHRILNLSAGFPDGAERLIQTGFYAASEDISEDFTNAFDQLHGGVFSTTQTFFNDSVSSDTNNRTLYPVEDGVIELYFGPQERIVKEVIDRIYAATASISIASELFQNAEVARALKYKYNAKDADGEPVFKVKLIFGQPNEADLAGIPVSIRPGIKGSLILIDGDVPLMEREQSQRTGSTPRPAPGVAMVLSIPLFHSAPYGTQPGNRGPEPFPQTSDRFADANMWVVQQNLIRPTEDFTRLRETFGTLDAEATSQGGLP